MLKVIEQPECKLFNKTKLGGLNSINSDLASNFNAKCTDLLYCISGCQNIVKRRTKGNQKNEFLLENHYKKQMLTLIKRTVKNISEIVVLAGLYHLDKLVKSDETLVDDSNFDLYFSLCTMESSKFFEDTFWDNRDYLLIFGLKDKISIKKYCKLEKLILEKLNWELFVNENDLKNFLNQFEK
eukprot:gene322-6736_t